MGRGIYTEKAVEAELRLLFAGRVDEAGIIERLILHGQTVPANVARFGWDISIGWTRTPAHRSVLIVGRFALHVAIFQGEDLRGEEVDGRGAADSPAEWFFRNARGKLYVDVYNTKAVELTRYSPRELGT